VERGARTKRTGNESDSGFVFAAHRGLREVRVGPPLDDEEDYELEVWAGVIPLRLTASAPVPDPRLSANVEARPTHRVRTRIGAMERFAFSHV